MKKTLLLVALAVSTMLSATDVIVLKNSTRIDAKILEVSETEIKYKKADNPDGPIFTQRVSGISVILYDNGDVVSYADRQEEDSRPQAQDQYSAPRERQEEAGAQSQAPREKKESKIRFNPQPSDNYIVGFTAGYVSKQVVNKSGSMKKTGSLLMGEEGKITPAMRAGLSINPTFKYGIGLRTGVYLEYAREVYSDADGDGDIDYGYYAEVKGAYHDITLSVPVQLSYRYEIIQKFSLMFYTGPVFDFGAYLAEEGTESRYKDGAKYSEDTYKTGNLYSKSESYKGFNALWGVGAGIQYSRFRLDIGGEFGMVKKNSESYITAHWDKPIYVTLTCFF